MGARYSNITLQIRGTSLRCFLPHFRVRRIDERVPRKTESNLCPGSSHALHGHTPFPAGVAGYARTRTMVPLFCLREYACMCPPFDSSLSATYRQIFHDRAPDPGEVAPAQTQDTYLYLPLPRSETKEIYFCAGDGPSPAPCCVVAIFTVSSAQFSDQLLMSDHNRMHC